MTNTNNTTTMTSTTATTGEDDASSSTAETAQAGNSRSRDSSVKKTLQNSNINVDNNNKNDNENNNISYSVINDLMRVYERLTQSSTPYSSQSRGQSIKQQQQQQQSLVMIQPQPEISSNPNTINNDNNYKTSISLSSSSMLDISTVYHNIMNNNPSAINNTDTNATSTSASHAPPYAASVMPVVPQFSDPPITAAQAQLNSSMWGIAASAASVTSSMHSCDSATSDGDVTITTTEGTTHHTSGRRGHKRKIQNNTGSGIQQHYGRKKSNDSDNRWRKRFAWPEEAHRDFVAAVFDVGLKQSSPATLLEFMTPNADITSERVKSHLQKYRLHRSKSKQEFMMTYDASLARFNQGHDNHASGRLLTSSPWKLSNADGAAWATYVMTKGNQQETNLPLASSVSGSANTLSQSTGNINLENGYPKPVSTEVPNMNPELDPQLHSSSNDKVNMNNKLSWPKLSEDEKKSPLGLSMSCLFGLYISLHTQLMQQRKLHQHQQQWHSTTLDNPSNSIYKYARNNDTSFPSSSSTAKAFSNPNQHPQQMEYHNHQNPTPVYVNAVSATAISSTHSREKQRLTSSIDGNPQHNDLPQSAILSSNISTNAKDDSASMMKREMQSQMALQNKMRIIMQQEMNKYSSNTSDAPDQKLQHNSSQQFDISMNSENSSHALGTSDGYCEILFPRVSTASPHDTETLNSTVVHASKGEISTERVKVANDTSGNELTTDVSALPEPRSRTHSFSGNDFDFWDTEVPDDDAVFEFLLS